MLVKHTLAALMLLVCHKDVPASDVLASMQRVAQITAEAQASSQQSTFAPAPLPSALALAALPTSATPPC